VQHEINRVDLAYPDAPDHERRRLVALVARRHRERENAELAELVASLDAAARRRLFDETLDPRLLAR
jgi:hypothetical protein